MIKQLGKRVKPPWKIAIVDDVSREITDRFITIDLPREPRIERRGHNYVLTAAETASFVALRTSGATPLMPSPRACLDQRANSPGEQRMTKRLVNDAGARPGFFLFDTTLIAVS